MCILGQDESDVPARCISDDQGAHLQWGWIGPDALFVFVVIPIPDGNHSMKVINLAGAIIFDDYIHIHEFLIGCEIHRFAIDRLIRHTQNGQCNATRLHAFTDFPGYDIRPPSWRCRRLTYLERNSARLHDRWRGHLQRRCGHCRSRRQEEDDRDGLAESED